MPFLIRTPTDNNAVSAQSHIDLGEFNTSGAWSVEVLGSLNSFNSSTWMKVESTATGEYAALSMSSNVVKVYSLGKTAGEGAIQLETNTDHLVKLSWDGTEYTLTVDGEIDYSVVPSSVFNDATSQITIFQEDHETRNYLSGDLKSITVVDSLGTTHSYAFSGTGLTLANANGNDATLINFPDTSSHWVSYTLPVFEVAILGNNAALPLGQLTLTALAKNASSSSVTYTWSVSGDGTLSAMTGDSVTLTCNSIGDITVSLVGNDGNEDSETYAMVVSVVDVSTTFVRQLLFPVGWDENFLPEEFKELNNSSFAIDINGRLYKGGPSPSEPFSLAFKDYGLSDIVIRANVDSNDFASREAGLAFRAIDETSFLYVHITATQAVLRVFSNGAYSDLDSFALTNPVANNQSYEVVYIVNNDKIILYKDGVREGEFQTSINQSATIHGFMVRTDRSARFGNVAFSSNLALTDIIIPTETIPPVLTVNNGLTTINKDETYVETSTAIDATDGDISRFIEYYNPQGERLEGVATNKLGKTDYILRVRDNNFNYSVGTKTIQVIEPNQELLKANRTMAIRHSIDKHASRIPLTVDGETGLVNHLVQLHKNDDVSYVLKDQEVEFNNGIAEIEVPVAPSFPYVGHVLESAVYPQTKGKAVVGATVGDLNVYANEILQAPNAMPSTGVVMIGSEAVVNDELNFTSAKGASCNYYKGVLLYCPNGAFDTLAPNTTDTDVINYTMSGNISRSITITIKASDSVGANVASTTTEETITHAFEEGATYEVAFTATGVTTGDIRPVTNGDASFVPSYGLSKNAREVWHLKVPANCTQITMQKNNGFDGAVTELHVKEVLKPTTVQAPRKLDVRQVNQRQQPEGAPVEGNCVIHPVLTTIVNPSNNPAITYKEDIESATLSNGSRIGYRSSGGGSYRFVDCQSFEAKEAIALYGGGDFAYIDNLFAEGGYPIDEDGRWEFELGMAFGDSGGQFPITYALNTYIDMKRNSINGQYSGPNNTECAVINRDYSSQTLQWEQTSYFYNIAFYNGGDGNIDAKTIVIVNQAESAYTWLPFRNHKYGIQLVSNTSIKQYDEAAANNTGGAFWVGYNSCRTIVFNTYVDGNRLVDLADTVGVIDGSNDNNDDASGAFIIMKTQPRMSDAIQSPMDEIEGQYKLSSDTDWTDLPKRTVGHSGDYRWRPTLPAGTYDFRCRTILSTQTSDWVETLGVVIA